MESTVFRTEWLPFCQKWFCFNVDGRNTRVDEAQPVPAMVVVEAMASVVVDVVVGVAADVVTNDRQIKAES